MSRIDQNGPSLQENSSTKESTAETSVAFLTAREQTSLMGLTAQSLENQLERRNQDGKQLKQALELQQDLALESQREFFRRQNLEIHFAAGINDVTTLSRLCNLDPRSCNSKDEYGRTPLMYAVTNGNLETVQVLLKARAKVNLVDIAGQTALHMAVHADNHMLLKTLLSVGAKAGIKDKSGQTPLHFAMCCDTIKCAVELLRCPVRNYINTKDHQQETPLHWACRYRKPQHVALLLLRGAREDLLDINQRTPLHAAAASGDPMCTSYLINSSSASLANKVDAQGFSALHIAAVHGSHNVIKVFARADGVDIDISDPNGRTPLHWSTASGKAQCVLALLDNGAHPCPIDEASRSPLDYGIELNTTESVIIPALTTAMEALKNGTYVLHSQTKRKGSYEQTENFMSISAALRLAKDTDRKESPLNLKSKPAPHADEPLKCASQKGKVMESPKSCLNLTKEGQREIANERETTSPSSTSLSESSVSNKPTLRRKKTVSFHTTLQSNESYEKSPQTHQRIINRQPTPLCTYQSVNSDHATNDLANGETISDSCENQQISNTVDVFEQDEVAASEEKKQTILQTSDISTETVFSFQEEKDITCKLHKNIVMASPQPKLKKQSQTNKGRSDVVIKDAVASRNPNLKEVRGKLPITQQKDVHHLNYMVSKENNHFESSASNSSRSSVVLKHLQVKYQNQSDVDENVLPNNMMEPLPLSPLQRSSTASPSSSGVPINYTTMYKQHNQQQVLKSPLSPLSTTRLSSTATSSQSSSNLANCKPNDLRRVRPDLNAHGQKYQSVTKRSKMRKKENFAQKHEKYLQETSLAFSDKKSLPKSFMYDTSSSTTSEYRISSFVSKPFSPSNLRKHQQRTDAQNRTYSSIRYAQVASPSNNEKQVSYISSSHFIPSAQTKERDDCMVGSDKPKTDVSSKVVIAQPNHSRSTRLRKESHQKQGYSSRIAHHRNRYDTTGTGRRKAGIESNELTHTHENTQELESGNKTSLALSHLDAVEQEQEAIANKMTSLSNRLKQLERSREKARLHPNRQQKIECMMDQVKNELADLSLHNQELMRQAQVLTPRAIPSQDEMDTVLKRD